MIYVSPFTWGVRRYFLSFFILTLSLAGCQSPEIFERTQARVPSERPILGGSGSSQQNLPSLPSPAVGAPAPQRVLPPGASPQLPSFLPFLNGPAGAVGTIPQDEVRVPPAATSDTVRIALLLPLTGSNAAIGKALLNAAQLALFDFADSRFELLPHDTKGTPEGAANAASLAIGDGAAVILGPLLSRNVAAVTPAAVAANVPVLAFSNDHEIAGNGVYTLGFLPSEQVARVVSYANSKGITRFAVLAPDNTYGARVVAAMRQTVDVLGASITRARFYDPSAQEFSDVIRQFGDYDIRRRALLEQRKVLEAQDDEISKRALKRLENLQTIGDLPFEALLVADGGKRLLSVAALLPFYDIDPGTVRMLGTGQWDEPGIGKEPALIGGWYAAPPPSARMEFEQLYTDTYGERPPRLVTMAYDATALVSVLARKEGGADFSPAALTNPNGFWGRDGVFRFIAGGTAERGLAVMEVGRDENRVISKAPETFAVLTN
ncbi:MAG: penicillin-binding protein activator [Rhodospirillales bacterium]|nr:penicillin-binding protein activator [Rhodospirillales bacterium]